MALKVPLALREADETWSSGSPANPGQAVRLRLGLLHLSLLALVRRSKSLWVKIIVRAEPFFWATVRLSVNQCESPQIDQLL